ncbi:MAG TPA: ABC transporter ATP-binding protein, partial [Planctomycetota bacterium]|nr:ABC transporter ATP-binding protein [Planctomycetota bacterium]
MSTDEMALEEELARVPLRRATWARLFRYLHPHRVPLAIGLSIEAFWVVLMLVDPWLVRRAVDGPLAQGDFQGVLAWAGALVGVLAFRAVITVIELRMTTRVGVQALHAVRQEVFDHLQRLSMRYFDRTKQGRIIARIDRDVETLEHTFSWGPVAFVNMAACLLFAFARIVWAHPYLTPFVLAAVPVLWGLTRLFERVGFPAYRRVRETHSAISAHVAERITGVRIVKGFAAEDREVEGLNVLQARYRDAVMGGARATAGFVPGLSLAIQALVVVAVVMGATRV